MDNAGSDLLEVIHFFTMETKGLVTSIAQDEFGKKIVVGMRDGTLELFYRDENQTPQKKFEVNAFVPQTISL